MDNVPSKRRFRFGLRSLLLLVLLCAIGVQLFLSNYSVLEHKAQEVQKGMTPDQVHSILGTPVSIETPGRWLNELYEEHGMWRPHVRAEVIYTDGVVVGVNMMKNGDTVTWRGIFGGNP